MQKIVIVANGAAYGSESLFNSLRLAIALREKESDLALRLFLMSDAVTAGLKGQKPAEGYNIQQMLEILTAQNVPVKLCKTCTDGRGMTGLPLIDGVEIGTLVELAEWTLSASSLPAGLPIGMETTQQVFHLCSDRFVHASSRRRQAVWSSPFSSTPLLTSRSHVRITSSHSAIS